MICIHFFHTEHLSICAKLSACCEWAREMLHVVEDICVHRKVFESPKVQSQVHPWIQIPMWAVLSDMNCMKSKQHYFLSDHSLQSCMNVKVTSTALIWRSSACSETEVTLKSENSIICCYFAINIYILDGLPAVWWQNRRWNTLKVTIKKHTNSFHDYFFILTGGRYHSSLTLFHSDCLSCSAFMVWMLQGKQVYVAMPSYWWQLSVTLTMKNLNTFFLRQVLHSKGATVLCHRLMPSLRFIC